MNDLVNNTPYPNTVVSNDAGSNMGMGGFVSGLVFGGLLTGGFGSRENIPLAISEGNNAVTNRVETTVGFTNQNINGVKDAVQNGLLLTQKNFCDLGHQNDMNTQMILADNQAQTTLLSNMIKDGEIRSLEKELAAVTLSAELSSRGLLTATGPAM